MHAAAAAGSSRPIRRAATGSADAVELLVELGFDVNAMGRADVPSSEPWQTALHRAADDGNLELARTPLHWARYFDRQPIIDLLEPVTPVPDEANKPNGANEERPTDRLP